MNDCKDCRHRRAGNYYDKCAAPRAKGSVWISCGVHRSAPAFVKTDCGSEGRFFESIPLGRSHGIDWDRAAMIVEFADMPPIEISEPVSMGELFSFSARFTVAEYLAALTTDYCAQGAAE